MLHEEKANSSLYIKEVHVVWVWVMLRCNLRRVGHSRLGTW